MDKRNNQNAADGAMRGGGGLWADVVAEVAARDAAAAEAALVEATSLGLHVEDYSCLEEDVLRITRADLIEDELAAKDRTRARIHVYAPPGDDADVLAEDVRMRLAAAGVRAKVEAGVVREQDWANNWKQYFRPFRVGEGFVVRPAWEDLSGFPLAPGDTVLAIDPGMAFGTGSHASTRLCLELLERRERGGAPISRVLDVGTGSGILAVASLLVGAKSALGVDIDVHALKNARSNAELNGVGGGAEFRAGDLAAGVSGVYDIVFANIVADAVIRLMGDAARLLSPGGALIASGIIEEREGGVLAAASAHGLRVSQTMREPPWVAMEMARV